MSDLSDFGVTPDVQPPTIRKQSQIIVPAPDQRKPVGWWGICPERDARAFVTERDSHKHRIRHLGSDKGGAYAISQSALREIADTGCTLVFIVETDTNTVLEYPLAEFTGPAANVVPDTFAESESDPQNFVVRDHAHHEWEGHRSSIYLARDAPVADPGPADIPPDTNGLDRIENGGSA